MAKLIDINGLAHVYSIIKGMLADKLGKNDTAVNASKVNNLTVETAVPKNAKFTDTVYTHPSTHPASMIIGLSTVATSGSYNDLTNKPTIPSAYTLPNATSSTLGGVKIGSNISVSSGTISITKSNVTSALGYTPPTSDTVYDNATATTAGLMSASDKVKLNNIADNANNYTHPSTHPASMITGLASVATSGSYNDLTNKPTIPVVPTKVSAFINDAGYLTQHQSLDGYAKEIVGTVIPYAGTSLPNGYLPCNGAAVSRETYADLFAVIGTTYGRGDGSTTFNLPNLTDKFIQGSDIAGTVKDAGLPNISGIIYVHTYKYASASGAFSSEIVATNTHSGANSDYSYTKIFFNASDSNGIYGNSATVQPPSLTMRYIIKY